jgi:hypothetical protein
MLMIALFLRKPWLATAEGSTITSSSFRTEPAATDLLHAAMKSGAREIPIPQTGKETVIQSQGTKTPAGRPAASTTPAKPPYGASNKPGTIEQYAELVVKPNPKLKGQLNSGFDPEILTLGAQLAAFHVEAGTRKFADVARAIAKDLDTDISSIRKYLRTWYNGARDMLEDFGFDVSDMDSADTVRAQVAVLSDQRAQMEIWKSQARRHWKEHLPTLYRQLKASGKLEAALKDAAERTFREMEELEEMGYDRQGAWEIVREQYLFPSEEGKTPAHDSPLWRASNRVSATDMLHEALRSGAREVTEPHHPSGSKAK